MSKQKVLAALMGMAFLTSSFAGIAEARGHGNSQDSPRAEYMKAYDDLSDAQKTAIKDLRKKLESDMEPIKVEIVKKETELKAIMKHDNPDAKLASNLAGEIEVLRQKVKDLNQNFHDALAKDYGLPEIPAHHMMRSGDKKDCQGNRANKGQKEGRGSNNKG